MSKKISELQSLEQGQIEGAMEFEIEQEGVSYKVSLALLIAFLGTYFMAAKKESALMPKSGGEFVGPVIHKDENPTELFAGRNIKAIPAANDPGTGAPLATGRVLLTYEE